MNICHYPLSNSTPQSTKYQIQVIVYSKPGQQIPEEVAVTLKFYHPELLDVANPSH